MGTRADFYIGRGKKAKWIGSTAWDGYPDGMEKELLKAKTEKDFSDAFNKHVTTREDFTSPDQGWPWPWNDSNTTDYAYSFDDGQVWANQFGHGWFKADEEEPQDVDDSKPTDFPDMAKKKNVAFGKRSGLVVISG